MPAASLDPRLPIGDILAEPLAADVGRLRRSWTMAEGTGEP